MQLFRSPAMPAQPSRNYARQSPATRSKKATVGKSRSFAPRGKRKLNGSTACTAKALSLRAKCIGVINNFTKPSDIMVCAAGSMPGDLHKLWRTCQPGGYHMEYGYSCMGYEIAGGLGVKMARPDRDVFVLVGDGSYLMMAQEIVTSLQEGCKLNIVLIDNHGFASIGGLSRSCGNEGMGTEYRHVRNGKYEGDLIQVDYRANAESLGAWAVRANSIDELKAALWMRRRSESRTSVIVVETAFDKRVPGYETWWDVPIAEVSEVPAVKSARRQYEMARQKERYFFGTDQQRGRVANPICWSTACGPAASQASPEPLGSRLLRNHPHLSDRRRAAIWRSAGTFATDTRSQLY